jgi:Tn3 transposase DDE domain
MSNISRRRGAYLRQNGLALALRELSRLERTIVTLKWLQEHALRAGAFQPGSVGVPDDLRVNFDCDRKAERCGC